MSGSESLVEFPALLLSQGCIVWKKDKNVYNTLSLKAQSLGMWKKRHWFYLIFKH